MSIIFCPRSGPFTLTIYKSCKRGKSHVIMVQIAMISPPYGLNLFVMKGAYPEASTAELYLGVIPFVAMQILVVIMLTIFPHIVLRLPSKIMG